MLNAPPPPPPVRPLEVRVPPPPPPPQAITTTEVTHDAGGVKVAVPAVVNNCVVNAGAGCCVMVTLLGTYLVPGGKTSVRYTPVCATVPVFSSTISYTLVSPRFQLPANCAVLVNVMPTVPAARLVAVAVSQSGCWSLCSRAVLTKLVDCSGLSTVAVK